MRLMTRCVLVVFLGSTGAAWADGDCGGHAATAAEKQFSVATLAALKALVPPAQPAGGSTIRRAIPTKPEIKALEAPIETLDEGAFLRRFHADFTHAFTDAPRILVAGNSSRRCNR